jgi:ketosteroid isomerase-like protein
MSGRIRRGPAGYRSEHTGGHRQVDGRSDYAGDVDAALSLYEPDATFAMPTGFGEGSVTGLAGLREALSGFLAMSPELKVNPEKTLLSGETAMVIGNWTLNGR